MEKKLKKSASRLNWVFEALKASQNINKNWWFPFLWFKCIPQNYILLLYVISGGLQTSHSIINLDIKSISQTKFDM